MYHFLSFLVLLLTLAGCATLPDVSDTVYGPPDFRTPRVVGARGELSPERSKRIVERLQRQSGTTDLLARQATVLEEITGSPLIAGNKATLLKDGEATYGAMFKAIRGARDHINFETFIFEDDDIGRRFADLLLEKQEQGVQVNLIYDSSGSGNTPEAFFERLRDSGINVLEFNPLNPLKAKKIDFLTHRDHRKILIVDGETAFTGGVNISEVYSSSPSGQGSSGKPWRDTHVQIEGPAVAEFQKLFLDTWKRQKGPGACAEKLLPGAEATGQRLDTGDRKHTWREEPRHIHHVCLGHHLCGKGYSSDHCLFCAGRTAMTALTDAAKRGLDVRLIVPGVSDSGLVFYAGRSH